MAHDPRKAAEAYLEHHKLPQLLETMTATLMFHKPADPRAFIIDYLTKAKTGGTSPLVNDTDLDTMFGMFDIVGRGVISSEQGDNALRSVLGPGSSLEAVGVAPGSVLTKDKFVDAMSRAIKANMPYAH
ncbi:hypothetical protein FOA52_015696 [Chlamydomonas sp. UWO 241]|nr:hypothetical protein FOA52_015696 [Chlamydomonas sp. UWO 241]